MKKSLNSSDPELDDFDSHEFAPTEILEELGDRKPKGAEKVVMVDLTTVIPH